MFFNVRKVNRIVKFDGSEHRRCEDIRGILAPEIGRPKSYGTFEKQLGPMQGSVRLRRTEKARLHRIMSFDVGNGLKPVQGNFLSRFVQECRFRR